MAKPNPKLRTVVVVLTASVGIGGKSRKAGERVEVRKDVAIELLARGRAKLADDSATLGESVDGDEITDVDKGGALTTKPGAEGGTEGGEPPVEPKGPRKSAAKSE